MNGTSLVSSGPFGSAPGSVWVAKATGDFDNNGYTDILFQNSVNGSCYIWEKAVGADNGSTSNNNFAKQGFVGALNDPNWKVVGSGDFNGDQTSDILFQNAIDGSCYIWQVDGSKPLDGMNALKGYGYIGKAVGADWKVKGVGDFDGDGVSDLVFQNARSGDVYVWDVDGSKPLDGWNSVKDAGYVGRSPGLDWQVKVVGDFNNDGKDDLLFQNAKDGSLYIWELDGVNKLVGEGYVGSVPGTAWEVKGAGDYNGDGKSDVLFQNAGTNQYYVWELNGPGPLVKGDFVGWTPPSEWHAII